MLRDKNDSLPSHCSKSAKSLNWLTVVVFASILHSRTPCQALSKASDITTDTPVKSQPFSNDLYILCLIDKVY